jgi:hypothetical protein
MPKLKPLFVSKEKSIADYLSIVAIQRGLYLTALYDKLGENLKVRSVTVDHDTGGYWLLTGIQGYAVRIRIFEDSLSELMDGNGQAVEIPKQP